MIPNEIIVKICEALFQVTALFTGILFSIYCFVIVSSNPFIDKIKNTQTYGRNKRYIAGTVSLGAFISIIALGIPLMPPTYTSVLFLFLVVLAIWWLYRLSKCMQRFYILSK